MLVSVKHKKLLLNLREPGRVTTVIPSAKTIQYKGRTVVVVPHRLDEVRVLRNLGFDAPAPVASYYEYQGRFDPFIHQRTTVEFLTTNPRAFCLNGMGCIEGDARIRVSRKSKSYETTLRELHGKFHELPDKHTWKARSLKDGVFGMNTILDVVAKGVKPTLRITLADGKCIRATPDHRMARPDGSWTDAGALQVGDELVTNGRVEVVCFKCGVPRSVADKYVAKKAARQHCNTCRGKANRGRFAGALNPAYKGTPFTDKDGYVRIWMPEHHRADNSGRVYEHILVAEAQVGYPIGRDMHVHHINGDKADNRPENLEVLSASEHHREHRPYAKLDGTRSGRGGVVVAVPKASKIVSIEYGGEVDVYDLCMEAPHHNFVVNGIVVHNSGKTISVLWAFDYLRKAGLVKRMLVIGPLSTLERAWGDEIYRNFPDMSFAVLHGTREKRHKLLAADFDVYIINHDGIKSKDTLELLSKREGLDVVVPDEIAEFRNASTDRWKALNLLCNGSEKLGWKPKNWVWGLTGTPIPNAPTDAWAQVRIIAPGRVAKYFGHFQDRVMKKITAFKWAPREGALEIVREAMQPAVRFSREECIDLPPTTYITRHAPLTAEQKRAFDEMLKKFKTEYAGGEINAVNAAVKLSKLLQICCLTGYTNVVTSRGLVPLQSVRDSDLLWDGKDWVTHGGVAYMGSKQTISALGVRMTPDHQVLSRAGWVTAQEAKDADAGDGFDGPEIRLPDGTVQGRVIFGQDKESNLALHLHLRRSSGPRKSELAIATPTQRKTLWMPPRGVGYQARKISQLYLQVVDSDASTLHAAQGQGLGQLRRSRHHNLHLVDRLVRCFLGRHGDPSPRYDTGSHRERKRVRSRKLSVGDAVGTRRESAQHALCGDPPRASPADQVGPLYWNEAGDSACAAGSRSAIGAGAVDERLEPVYDILNAGPRSRFVVQGEDGRFLVVHNCGVAYGATGEVVIPSQPRMDLVRELIDEAEAKVLVFVPFTAALNALATELRKHYTVEVVYGDVSKTERDRIFQDFQNSNNPRVIVSDSRTMSHGLTLTAANTTIWYGPAPSSSTYQQANERTPRPGQKLQTVICHIEGSAVERMVYDRLQGKKALQGVLLELLKGA